MSTPKDSKKTSSSDSSAKKSALFCARPNRGLAGRVISLLSNHFALRFDADLIVHHYDVEIEPMEQSFGERPDLTFGGDEKCDKRRFRRLNNKIYRVVMEEAFAQHSSADGLFHAVRPVFDGQRNLYACRQLPIDALAAKASAETRAVARVVVEVVDDGRPTKFALYVKYASAIDMNALKLFFDGHIEVAPSDALQVLNIVLRHGPTQYRVPIGNSLYAPHNEAAGQRQDIGGGRQLAYGYFQSVRPGFSGVNLVVDRTATALFEAAFVPKFLAKVLGLSREEFMAIRGFKDSDRNRIKKELNGLQIQVKHLTYKRRYKVMGITAQSAIETRFEVKKTDPKGKEVNLGNKSVVEFFETYYPDVKLRFAHLPCLIVGSTKSPNYIPLDVCEIAPDQHVRQNLTADQMAQMIRASASQLPHDRLEFTKRSANDTIRESLPFMEEFGLSFPSTAPLRVEGRVLPPPNLAYGHNRNLSPFDGKWDLKGGDQFYKPASLSSWIIVSMSASAKSKMDDLERMIIETGRKLGMTIACATKKVSLQNYNAETIPKVFAKALEVTAGRLEMIVFILHPQYQYLYESIKKVGDIDFGVVTQCIKESNVRNLRPALMQNLMLKINTKLGGVNTVVPNVEKLRTKTMIVGVDCSHPGLGDRMSKSVAAAVASYDSTYAQYFSRTRILGGQEIANELREMMVELLEEFLAVNGGPPEQIIIYRDGVSEGQFDAALKQEFKALKDAYSKVRADFEPKITYVVVQKGHHTRLFPENRADGVGRAKNVPPGTVVDTDIVSRVHFDFYMASHEGIQGTSRPTHYYVLHDDNHLTSDHVQLITFGLCHIYARCNRSIAQPAPVGYAHLAAYRAQRHIIGLKQCEDSDSGSEFGAQPRRHGEGGQALGAKVKVSAEYSKKLYYV